MSEASHIFLSCIADGYGVGGGGRMGACCLYAMDGEAIQDAGHIGALPSAYCSFMMDMAVASPLAGQNLLMFRSCLCVLYINCS